MKPFARYLAAEQALNEGLIRLERSMRSEHLPLTDAHQKMATMRAFLEDLGNPQKGIPALHVAGTSGKGSVCAAAAGILRTLGLRVGLHVSPYLQAAVEKTWVEGRYVSADAFADAVDRVLPVARRFLEADTPGSVHGMASVAVSLLLFQQQHLDVMVFEVGCGGRFDLSSIVETVTAVVTNVGLDHVRTLGSTIEQIAWHKAGVARPGVPLITGASGAALDVVREECERVGAPLEIVARDRDAFAHNRSMAKRAAAHTAQALGRRMEDDGDGVNVVLLPGRSEKMPCSQPVVILDGAHNADKLAAAVDAALPQMGAGPKIGLFGVLGAKVGPTLAAPFAGRFDQIVVTEPSVYGKPSSPCEETAKMFAGSGCKVTVVRDPQEALTQAMAAAGASGGVFATGSFYLIGALRERFYAKERVVLERTSFPSRSL